MLVCGVYWQGRGRFSGSVHAAGIEQHEPPECRFNIPSAYTDVVGCIDRFNSKAVVYLVYAFSRFLPVLTGSNWPILLKKSVCPNCLLIGW
jgi:hypothetical protein